MLHIAPNIDKIGFMGYCIILLKYGGGLHQWDVPEKLLVKHNQTVYATMVNYGPTVFAIKAAILLFLARIFSPYKTYVKWIYGFLGVMAIYYIVMMALKTLICRPVHKFWDPDADGQCFNQRVLILTDNVISLLSDIVAKLKIVAIFGVGGIACIFDLVRLVFIIKDGESADQTYTFVQINLTGPSFTKTKPGYSTSSKSQFEMMSSTQKKSRNMTHTRTTSGHFKDETDSDENGLMPLGKAYVTTKVRGGEDNSECNSATGDSAGGFRPSIDDTRICRTVEVR
ncbi:hypothetical protein N0V84_000148 [Fusarium piperis]|uniref:Rhodopsin domain-containing protein n=1 Tax=Fusarium piperis TaxID=1435070 RepID=A0A9W9BUF8_9HYPO|nr:hypothetical protein N0V84_000148 [Fusarium piperis]